MMVICNICGKEFMSITSHIFFKHQLSKEQYLIKFPGSKIVSDELSQKFSENARAIHKTLKEADLQKYQEVRSRTCKTMRNNKGDNFTHSPETIKKMKLSHIGVSNGGHTEATKEIIRQQKIGKPMNLSDEARKLKTEKQKKRWEERRSDPNFANYLSVLSVRSIEYIKEHGVSVPKKGKKTDIERRFCEFLDSHKIIYEFQYFLEGKYYDFFIPSMNMLVETDGEFWHRFDRAIKNDLEKHQIAKEKNIKLLRITSENWNTALLFEEDYEKIKQHNFSIINERTIKCQNYQISISMI